MQYLSVLLLCLSSPILGDILSVDWPSYLARSDLIWQWDASKNRPDEWGKSAFIGNGNIGSMIWSDSLQSLRFDISRTDVYDDRMPGNPYYLNNFVYDQPRLPIGHFELLFSGTFQKGTFHQDLWNAEVRGVVTTDQGTLTFTYLSHANTDVFLLQINTTGGEKNAQWLWVPEVAASTWAPADGYVYNPSAKQTQSNGFYLTEQPLLGGNGFSTAFTIVPPSSGGGGGYSMLTNSIGATIQCPDNTTVSGYCIVDKGIAQNLCDSLAGCNMWMVTSNSGWNQAHPNSAQLGTYPVTANNEWTSYVKGGIPLSNPSQNIFISISPVIANSLTWVQSTISSAQSQGWNSLISSHREWWTNYYPQSFLTFHDTKLETFYWIQMYKMACATRSDKAPFDLEGPWFVDGTAWPDLHEDLNVELVYWPIYTANRLDLGLSLVKLMNNDLQYLINNVPVQFRNDSAAAPTGASSLLMMETCYWDYGPDCLTAPPSIVGNLLWMCHNYYLQYEFSQDSSLLTSLYPILSRAVNYYTHLQILNNSQYHLPTTFSPEYPGNRGPDTNYDLALYRWGLQTIINIATQLGKTNDPQFPVWQDSLNKLTAYPTNQNGYMVAATVPYDISHRHFSHLFMIFPLLTVDWNPQNLVQQNLTRTSVDWWYSLNSQWTGFPYVAISSMSILLGRPEAAYNNLTHLVDNYILPNTMYRESQTGACGETPPAAASTLQDMVLFSRRNNIIEVFSGVSSDSKSNKTIGDVSFYRLRTIGAFLISAVRKNAVTQFIRIESSTGLPATLQTDLQSPINIDPAGTPFNISATTPGLLTVSLKAGQMAYLYSGSTPPDYTIIPDPGVSSQFNYWGVH